MQQPKIEVEDKALPSMLNKMETGEIQVPRFQRDFVWPVAKTRALLDSIYKEFPIGTFFLWRASAKSPSLFRSLEEFGIPAPKGDSGLWYILDGQQRLASLFFVVQGIKLRSRDYSRICIDLETATRYAQSEEEGFEEDIFVYRRGDNERYVAVRDLVREDHLDIYDQIPPDWKLAFNKAYRLFTTYPLSVVWITEQELSNAIVIFQRINQGGKRLSRYDLICANVWTEDFDFRKRVEALNKKFAQAGFGELDETVYTQAFALILKERCTTVVELSLETDEIVKSWEAVVKALQLAVDFVVNNLGVRRSEYLPYRGILPVLAYYFYNASSGTISAPERDLLWTWFWQVALSERYGSTSPSRMAEDAQKLRALLDGEDVFFDFPSKATPDAVARTKMTSTASALRNAVICMLALKRPRNLKDGSPVNLGDGFFSDLKKAERHHIFPVGYLKKRNWAGGQVHLVPNFCFIPADLNKEIGSRAPSDYLKQYEDENDDFWGAAESQLLPVRPGTSVWKDDFQGFLSERAQLIAAELNRLAGTRPGEPESTPPVDAVDILEIRLRDFIDHRLAAVVGPSYWKQTMPGDVITTVIDRISEWQSRHPYEDSSQFESGRKRLDFCDVSHYEKIILKNWGQFEEFFQRKDQFQRHIEAYRTLRNCVQHARESTDIEREMGESAMKWLERILDKYDQEYLDLAEESEEEPVGVEVREDRHGS